MSAAVDELRPLTAGRLLTLRREVRERTEDALEQALLCNAAVLAESCRRQGEPVFLDSAAVLERLTCREMEALLSALAEGRPPDGAGDAPAWVNPRFDDERFRRLREGST